MLFKSSVLCGSARDREEGRPTRLSQERQLAVGQTQQKITRVRTTYIPCSFPGSRLEPGGRVLLVQAKIGSPAHGGLLRRRASTRPTSKGRPICCQAWSPHSVSRTTWTRTRTHHGAVLKILARPPFFTRGSAKTYLGPTRVIRPRRQTTEVS